MKGGWVTFGILLLTAPFWWAGLARFLQPPDDFSSLPIVTEKSTRIFSMQGVHFSQHTVTDEEWKIKAEQLASVPGQPALLELKQVDAQFRGKDAKLALTINCPAARYDTNREVLTLGADVSVRTADGYDFKTSSLTYWPRKYEFDSEDEVHVKGNGMDVRGEGFHYNFRSGILKVAGPLRVKVW